LGCACVVGVSVVGVVGGVVVTRGCERGRRHRGREREVQIREQRRDLRRLEHGRLDEERRPLARHEVGVGLDEPFDLLARPLARRAERGARDGLRLECSGILPHAQRLHGATGRSFGGCARNITLTANSSQLFFRQDPEFRVSGFAEAILTGAPGVGLSRSWRGRRAGIPRRRAPSPRWST
jgi:hypothetical protein